MNIKIEKIEIELNDKEIEVRPFSKADVVFIVRDGTNGSFHGCFHNREDAEKYITGSPSMRIQELSVL